MRKQSSYLEWLVANMRFYVLHQQTALLKLLRAQRTLVEHRLSMRHNVLLQQVVVAKFLSAFINRADDGNRRPSMSFLMQCKTGCIEEALITLLTLEGLVREM